MLPARTGIRGLGLALLLLSLGPWAVLALSFQLQASPSRTLFVISSVATLTAFFALAALVIWLVRQAPLSDAQLYLVISVCLVANVLGLTWSVFYLTAASRRP